MPVIIITETDTCTSRVVWLTCWLVMSELRAVNRTGTRCCRCGSRWLSTKRRRFSVEGHQEWFLLQLVVHLPAWLFKWTRVTRRNLPQLGNTPERTRTRIRKLWNSRLHLDLSNSQSLLNYKQRERELRTQNSELYYSRIEILGSSLFLQSVLAKLHRQHI